MCNNVIFRLLFPCIILTVYLEEGACLGDNAYDDVILPYWKGTTEVTETTKITKLTSTKSSATHHHHRKKKKNVSVTYNVMPWMLRLYSSKRQAVTSGARLPMMDFLEDSHGLSTNKNNRAYLILAKQHKGGRNLSEDRDTGHKNHHTDKNHRGIHVGTEQRWQVRNPYKNSDQHRRNLPINMYSLKMPELHARANDDQPSTGQPGIDLEHNECDGNDIIRPQALLKLMKCIASKDPESRISTEVIGRTSEYNDIILMRISRETSVVLRSNDNIYVNEPPPKKTVFIVHGLNVQGMRELECLSHPKNLTKLMGYYFKHLDKFDILFMPLANPDGFSYARTNSLWNKNLSPQNACPGVALDKNFDIVWAKSQKSSCSQHFEGESAFSEPETRAIKKIFHDYHHKIIAFINVHASSFDKDVFKGDAILYPKGYTDKSSDEEKYTDLKSDVEDMMKNASFQVISVTVDSLYNWYGRVAGTSVDYASAVYGIPFALEFAMQQYKDGPNFKPTKRKSYATLALEEIWQKIIDVTFENIYKTVNNSASHKHNRK